MNDHVLIPVGSRKYPGLMAKVDAADAEEIGAKTWYACRPNPRRDVFYAMTRTPAGMVYMHRVILGAPKGLQVDHANHDTLDNRRSNLRLATRSQNQANSRSKSRTGYRGVITAPWSTKFFARLNTAGFPSYLGAYDTAEEAARAYDAVAVQAFGEFATLNFPDHTAAGPRAVAG